MPNLQKEKTPMKEQDPALRAKNFSEVTLGYTAPEAVNEALRCLDCRHRPCVSGCPVNVAIPDFIKKIAEGNFPEAYEIIKETNALPAVCGRVCPQERQCELKCVRGAKGEPVAIGRLERFAADYALENPSGAPAPSVKKLDKKVAVIGAGPAGLACAGELLRLGFDVTVFEAFHVAGGVLVYGIPEFRLPKKIVAHEIDQLIAAGAKIALDTVVGKTVTVDELFEDGYSAVFIGTGAGLPSFMKIPGENLNGVYSANEFLTRINLMKAYLDDYDTPIKRAKRVGVIGGGNVAMDAARCALRMGAEKVMIIYRRSMEELPARAEEIHHALEEGVEFHTLSSPVEILDSGDGSVGGIRCVKMELGAAGADGRRSFSAIPESEFTIPLDGVIMSIGTSPNPLIRMTTEGLSVNGRGCIEARDEFGRTSKPGVYAGGDAVTGAATVILAMGAGRKAAGAIYDDLCGGKSGAEE